MKILVISLAGIGDTLIATPFIRELRENFPGMAIDALVRWPGAKDLLEHNPNVNRVFQKDLMTCGKFAALRFLPDAATGALPAFHQHSPAGPDALSHGRVAGGRRGAHQSRI